MTLMNRRQTLRAASALGAASLLGFDALAQPRIEVAKIVTGFAPGGTTDAIARRLADAMMGSYARSVIVENRTGAATRIGIEAVKNAPADGTVMLITPAGMMYVYPHIYEKLSYDPFKDFVPVSTIATTGFALVVGPAVPASVTNVAQFADWSRANPKQATYGSPASGSMPHLMVEALRRKLDLDLVHVGYRGAAPAVQDLVAGQIPAATSGLSDFLPYLEGDRKLRVLATSGKQRTKYTPSVPTFVEQGLDGFVFTEDYAIFMPARAPAAAVDRLAEEIKACIQKPAVQETLLKFALEPGATTPAELGRTLKTEYERWGPIIKTIGFKAD
jgi:tripartite-type tricarboxylate transporter receptor subunit TctC